MEIKKNLKQFDIKISKLASELGISRPTLDNYIECFEKGIPISNNTYQKIFEYLFSSECKTTIEFAQKYDYVKRTMLNDAKKETLNYKIDQRTEQLISNIYNALKSGIINKELLEFINLFVNNSEVALVKGIYEYFNYTNGYKKINDASINIKDKALFSTLIKVFADYNDNKISFDQEAYNQLVDKNIRMYEKKAIKVDNEDIINYIKENISDSSNIDFDLLKQMIESRKEE